MSRMEPGRLHNWVTSLCFVLFCSQCYLKIFQSSFNIREPNYKKNHKLLNYLQVIGYYNLKEFLYSFSPVHTLLELGIWGSIKFFFSTHIGGQNQNQDEDLSLVAPSVLIVFISQLRKKTISRTKSLSFSLGGIFFWAHCIPMMFIMLTHGNLGKMCTCTHIQVFNWSHFQIFFEAIRSQLWVCEGRSVSSKKSK